MEKPIIIHHSDNINIKYIENRVNEKNVLLDYKVLTKKLI